MLKEDRTNWIRKNCTVDDKIVDIGGNKGHVFYGWDRDKITTVDLDVYDIPNFVQANAEDLPFKDNSFDIAVLAEIVEHVESPEKAIKEALRVAKKVIITVPYEHKWAKETVPFHYFDDIIKETNGDLKSEAVKGNPECKEFYTKDNYKHLFHHRFFTPETLTELIDSIFDEDYYVVEIENGTLPCIGAVLQQ